jgi:hypothetical protein
LAEKHPVKYDVTKSTKEKKEPEKKRKLSSE